MLSDFWEAYDLEYREEQAWLEELAAEAASEELPLIPFVPMDEPPFPTHLLLPELEPESEWSGEPPLHLQDDPSDRQLVGRR
jgi:hypothetical protein